MERLNISMNFGDEGAFLFAACVSKIRMLEFVGWKLTLKGIKALTSQIMLVDAPVCL